MVDPISNAPSSRQIGPTKSRSQASSGSPGARDGLGSTQRVEPPAAALDKLIKKNPPKHPRFRSASDEEGSAGSSNAEDVGDGTGDAQWPPTQLLKLRHYLKQMEGLLLDTEV